MKIYIYTDVTELSKTSSTLALKDNKNNSQEKMNCSPQVFCFMPKEQNYQPFYQLSEVLTIKKKRYKHIFTYMKQRNKGHVKIIMMEFFSRCTKPSKIFVFQIRFFEIILCTTATSIFLVKQRRGANFLVTWNYYIYLSSIFFHSYPQLFPSKILTIKTQEIEIDCFY